MKLDIDCVRDVLLTIEKLSMGCHGIDAFVKQTAKYGEENVQYTLAKLVEADFLIADIPMDEGGYYHYISVYCMKYAGHQFLDTIREPKIWKQTKSIAEKVGVFSIDFITKIATSVIVELLKPHLSAPNA